MNNQKDIEILQTIGLLNQRNYFIVTFGVEYTELDLLEYKQLLKEWFKYTTKDKIYLKDIKCKLKGNNIYAQLKIVAIDFTKDDLADYFKHNENKEAAISQKISYPLRELVDTISILETNNDFN